ncbi:MAG: PHB depolymerase family esterase [Xanthobacteraceae bacterium]|nr:PHB depolymerase family esterase [Xanthobacteraceae bacterium]
MSLAQNVEFMRQFSKLSGFNGLGAYGRTAVPSPLVEINEFGTNPGALKMFAFVPEHLPSASALVVVLHGCGQTAAGYNLGAGWSTLAKRYGFALLLPEQQASNNANTCFNWFSPGDIARGRGEAASIRQMIARMVADHKIDARRIFVTGLSAGGAMTSVMLATYPEVFAGGAVIAGLPFGIASNVREALSGMMQSPSRPAHELGDLVRKASKHKGPWPKLSVWHGSADRTVNPGNADEIVKQWLDVHGLPSAPMSTADVDGYPRDVWWNADGETVVESYTITNMAHGTPLGLAGADEAYGVEGAFLIEAGISSSYHIANFFGLTERVSQPNAAARQSVKTPTIPSAATVSLQSPDLVATLWPRTTLVHHAKPRENKPREAAPAREPKRIDVSAVITRALTAAGLMK